MSEKRWAAEKRIALRTNPIEVLIQEARWQLDEHGSLDYRLAHELIIRASNQQQRISELVQQCEKLREERNTARVKVEQPLLLRIRELEATKEMLCQQLRKVELRLRIAVSVAVGSTAGLVTSLLF